MTDEKCPEAAVLCDYAVGRLSDAESDSLAAHLDACPICRAELDTVEDADDTLVRRLRQPVTAEPYLDESHCSLALARAKGVAGRSGTGAPDAGNDPSSAAPGTLGEYRLLKRLGQGGMGTVYQALHTKLDRVVALKILPKRRLEDRQAVARFEREMRAVGQLDHPNIVQAYDAREIDDMPVLIMQYVEGMDLGELMRRLGRLPVADACELARQAALALQYAHENGLVHRDVKPSNLMLTRQGELKLLDLGLARFYLESPAGAEVTDTGQTMGTADYMAPEQVSSSRQVDIRADVYSLGCTLYKLLSGRAPFSGPEYPGKFEKMTAHVEKPVPPIRELVPEVPAALAGLLDRMLAKDPDGRPATPAEVAESLEPFCRGHSLPELVKQADKKAPAIQAATAQAQPAGGPPCPAPSIDEPRSIRLSAAVGLMLLSFVVGLALGIVIRIERNGEITELTVPDGSRVEIGEQGQVDLKLPGPAEAAQTPRVAAVAQLAALRGWWEVVSVERGEAADLFVEGPDIVPRFDPADIDRVLIKDDLQWYDLDGGVVFSIGYTLNPAPSPGTIDLLTPSIGEEPAEMFAQGVYALEGDTLQICVARYLPSLVAEQRPEDFQVEPRSGDVLFTLRRYEFTADEKALQEGRWRLVSAVVDGRALPDEELVGSPSSYGEEAGAERNARFSFGWYHFFTNAKFLPSLLVDGGWFGSDVNGYYALDPSQHPKAIKLNCRTGMWGTKVLGGIYELSGDRLRIAWRVGGPRPEAFESKPGSGVTLIELVREQPEAPKEPAPAQAAPSPPTEAPPATANAEAKGPDAVQSLKAFQGLWEVVSVEQGKAADFGRAGSYFSVPLDPTEIDRVAIQERIELFDFDETWVVSLDYLLNPVPSPSTVDLLRSVGDKDPEGVGIYELARESLKICFTRPLPKLAGGQRPEDFDVEPDSADVLFTLRRYEFSPDEQALHGHWRFDSLVVDGLELPAEGEEWRIIFPPSSWIYFAPESVVGRSARIGLYVVDTRSEPKSITLSPFGCPPPSVEAEPLHGIYEFDGDQLRIAWREGGPRPKEFQSEPGSGVTLMELERGGAEALAPRLSVEISGPDSRAVGESALFSFTVSNTGAPAQGVELAVTFDPQLVPPRAPPSQYREDGAMLRTLDTLPAGATLRLGVECQCAAEAPQARIWATVTAEGGAKATDEACVRIVPDPDAASGSGRQRLEAVAIQGKPAAAHPDHEAIQGVWQAVAGRFQGEELPQQRFEDTDIVFAQGRYRGVHPGPEGGVTSGSYVLDPTRHPKWIDFESGKKQRSFFGVYELDGDRLRLCSPMPGSPRPTGFVSEKERPNDGLLVELRRVGNAEAALARFGVVPSLAPTRGTATRDLEQIGLAMHMFHDACKHFPPAVLHQPLRDEPTAVGAGVPPGWQPYSWRVALLPYLGHAELYEQYRFDEPWDSPANKKVLDQMPEVYRHPSAPPDSTNAAYFLLTGPGTIFDGERGSRFADIPDGTSNTILAVEAKREIPWTKPEDIPFDPAKPLPKLGGFAPGGFHAVLADTSTRFVPESMDDDMLRAALQKADGQVVVWRER